MIISPSGNTIFFWILAIPALGFTLAITLNSMWWLVLLLPLFALMEGGIFLIIVIVFITAGTIQ